MLLGIILYEIRMGVRRVYRWWGYCVFIFERGEFNLIDLEKGVIK